MTCATCEREKLNPGTLCDPCWEVERRLETYAASAGGRRKLLEALGDTEPLLWAYTLDPDYEKRNPLDLDTGINQALHNFRQDNPEREVHAFQVVSYHDKWYLPFRWCPITISGTWS